MDMDMDGTRQQEHMNVTEVEETDSEAHLTFQFI